MQPNNIQSSIVRCGDHALQLEIQSKGTDHSIYTQNSQQIFRISLPEGHDANLGRYRSVLGTIMKNVVYENNIVRSDDLEDVLVIDSSRKTQIRLVKPGKGIQHFFMKMLNRLGIFKMVHLEGSSGIVDLKLEEEPKKRSWVEWFVDLFRGGENDVDIPAANVALPTCKDDRSRFNRGVGEAFSDAFTEISTYAYQYLEKDFEGHDGDAPNEILSDYMITYNDANHEVSLIHKDEKEEHIDELNTARDLFLQRFEREHGKEKMDYILHQAGLEFTEESVLTPEHVYRMNILACNLESQDIGALMSKMQYAHDLMAGREDNEDLLEIFRQDSALRRLCSTSDVRSILRFLKGGSDRKPNVGDLREALGQLNYQKNSMYKASLIRSLILSGDLSRIENDSFADYLNNLPQGILEEGDREKVILLAKVFSWDGSGDFDKYQPTVGQYVKALQKLSLARNEMRTQGTGDTLLKDFMADFVKNHPHFYSDGGDEMVEIIRGAVKSVYGDGKVSDFLERMEEPDRHVSASSMDGLIHAMKPTTEERNKAYTGREIKRPIDSSYTTADFKFYKPWIDQQELVQSFDFLETDTIYDPYLKKERVLSADEKQRRFDEFASFIFCKKHLFRKHPQEGYRVGALIPAPSDDEGNKRWYRVDRMVSGNEGLLYYVLEPVGNDSTLPTYITPRSTSSNTYAYQSGATVRNDFNPINSPGYEGRRHIGVGLEQVRKEHTVATWAAYAMSAEKAEDPAKANVLLLKARKAMCEDIVREHGRKSLHSLVKEFDGELNDVTWKTASRANFIPSTVAANTPLKHIGGTRAHFIYLIQKYAHEYSKQQIQNESPEEREKRVRKERKHALELIEFIEKNFEVEEVPPTIQEFIEALKMHVTEPKDDQVLTESELIAKYLPQEFKDIGTKPASESIAEIIEYAKKHGEDLESKKSNGLRICGHSLGASTAQVEAYYTTAGSNRMPVPGCALQVRLYDDPGMNEEDNVHLYEFIADHHELMRDLDVSIDVYHSHDYGDIVPTGAKAHMGGYTPKIQKMLERKVSGEPGSENNAEQRDHLLSEINRVLIVNTEIKRPTEDVLESETGDVAFKHGTRYETAKRENTRALEEVRTVTQNIAKRRIGLNLRMLGNYVLQLTKEPRDPAAMITEYATRVKKSKEAERYLELRFRESKNDEELQEFNKLDKVFGRFFVKAKRVRGNKERFLLNDKIKEQIDSFRADFEAYDGFIQDLRNTTDPEARKILKQRIESLDRKLHKEYDEFLLEVAKEYKGQLQVESKSVESRAKGGVAVTHVSASQLGVLSGSGFFKARQARKVWGTGIFDANRSAKNSVFLGSQIGPAFLKRLFTAERREDNLHKKGHGKATKVWNPKTRTLIIDSSAGAYY